MFLKDVSIGVMQLPEAIGTDTPITYSLTGTLANGLSFNGTTRQITGVPTEIKSATDYTYTATDSDGSTADAPFKITVVSNEQPILLGEVEDQTYISGSAIPNLLLPLASRGSEPYAYSLSPAAPAGLSFDANTRVISGTPTTAQAATSYTYRATDSATTPQSASQEFTIAVLADSQPSFDDIEDQFYTNGYAIDPLQLPDAQGGNVPLTYRLNGTLAPGLTYNSADNTITGTPTATLSATEYEWIATDVDGDSASVKFNITVGGPYDYDVDDDGLIEISTLAQLAAIDHDLDGNGSENADYRLAFSPFEPRPNFGCNNDASACNGYELIADLDFDTTGDGKANEPHPKTNTTGCVKDAAGNWPIDHVECEYDAYWNDGKGWDPIGDSGNWKTDYRGTFEGNGGSISNLYIYRDRATEPDAAFNIYGLFSSLHRNSTVRNLSILDADVTASTTSDRWSSSGVGIVAGRSEGYIHDVTVSGRVRGGSYRSRSALDYVGGLVGRVGLSDCRYNYPTTKIRRSHSSATVEPIPPTNSDVRIRTRVAAGGLVGYAFNDYLISESSSSGDVTGTFYAGGLVAEADYFDDDCTRDDEIIDSFSTANVTGKNAAGGLVGWLEGDTKDNRVNIKGSYSTGTVESDDTAGGLFGYAQSYRLESSYFAGQVVSTGSHDGGIVGKIKDTKSDRIVDMDGAIAIGMMPDESDGIVGTFDSGARWDIDDTYWDTDVTNIADPVEPLPTDADQSLGKTTAELQNPRSATGIYENFDTNYWVFRKSCDYPVLKVDFDGDGVATWEEFGTQSPSADNCPPIVINPIGARTVFVGTPQTIQLENVGDEVFFDDEGDDLTYTMTVTGHDNIGTATYSSTDQTISLSGINNGTFTVDITASDGVNSKTATDTFAVTIAGDFSPVLESIPDHAYHVGSVIDPLELNPATSGNGAITYSFTDKDANTLNLPAGLSYDSTSEPRTITGTPTTVTAAKEFTYKATDADGDTTEVSFSITVVPDGEPIFGAAIIEDQVYKENTSIAILTLPQATGADGTISYSLTGILPVGLSFSASTREISGTLGPQYGAGSDAIYLHCDGR